MNYCRKCQSDYEKPGTCNCFAEQAPREDVAPPPVFVPCVPWVYPTYIPPWTSIYPTYPWTSPTVVPLIWGSETEDDTGAGTATSASLIGRALPSGGAAFTVAGSA